MEAVLEDPARTRGPAVLLSGVRRLRRHCPRVCPGLEPWAIGTLVARHAEDARVAPRRRALARRREEDQVAPRHLHDLELALDLVVEAGWALVHLSRVGTRLIGAG